MLYDSGRKTSPKKVTRGEAAALINARPLLRRCESQSNGCRTSCDASVTRGSRVGPCRTPNNLLAQRAVIRAS
eukprot:scaffold171749_cov30-Tisochrysis_lutea.AAC.2